MPCWKFGAHDMVGLRQKRINFFTKLFVLEGLRQKIVGASG